MIEELEGRLRADLDNLDLWEVYGDVLQHDDDARGEMIALARRLELEPSAGAWHQLQSYLQAHCKAFFGERANVVSTDTVDLVKDPVRRTHLLHLELWMGHVRAVHIQVDVDEPDLDWWHDAVRDALGSPLTLFAEALHARAPFGAEAVLREVLSIRPLPFRVVRIGDAGREYHHLPPLGAFLEACPRMETLAMVGTLPPVQRLSHESLRELEVRGPIPAELPAMLTGLDLRRVNLHHRTVDHWDQQEPIGGLDAGTLEELASSVDELVLSGPWEGVLGLEKLPCRLGLVQMGLTDANIDALVAREADWIDLHGNRFSGEGRRLLRAHFGQALRI